MSTSHDSSISLINPDCLILVTGLLLFLVPRVSPGQELPIQSYTIREGLPSNTIKTLIQDSYGYIWVGTTNGLAQYDGYQFRVYTTINGLSDNYITGLAESSAEPGVIWIGTVSGGLCKFENGTCLVIDGGDNPIDRSISDLLVDRNGRVWYGNAMGLKIIDHAAPRWIRKGSSSASNTLLAQSRDGTVFVSMYDTLYRMSGEDPIPVQLPSGMTQPLVALTGDSSNNIWEMRQDSLLIRYTNSRITYQRKLPFDPGLSMAYDGQGNLWLSLHRNVVKLLIEDPDKLTSFDRSDGLPEALLGPLLIDREKTLWVGTIADGLIKLSHFNYRTLPTSGSGRSSRNIWGIYDTHERYWIGTAGQFFEVYTTPDEHMNIATHHIREAGPAVEILPLGLGDSSTLFASAADRTVLYRYHVTSRSGQPSSLRELPSIPVQALLSGTILNGCTTRDGDILLGIAGVGLAVFGKNEIRPRQSITSADGLRGSTILVLYEDVNGDVWAGDFHEGLTHLHKDRDRWKVMRSYTVEDGLPDNHIRSIAQDAEGRFWIGTRYGGVTCTDGQMFRTLSRKDGLHGDKIWDIAPGQRQTVWVGTDYGLERIDAKNFTVVPVASLLSGSNVFRCGITRDGKVWFLTAYSLNVYDYLREESNLIPPQARITGFTVNGKSRDLSALPELESDEDDCIIDFVGLSYRDDGVKQYQYMLAGMDHDWHTTSQRAVTMAGLGPRKYTFLVRAVNSDGVSSAKPAMLQFHILQPLWQRWWFLTAGACLIAGMMAYAVRRRLRRLERERLLQFEFSSRLIASQENERKRIALELHDSIGQNLLIIKNHAIFGLQSSGEDPAVTEHLREISALSSDTIQQAREISYNLRPYQIDRIGLTKALQSIVKRISQATTVMISSEFDNVDEVFPREQEIIIYRILQEALNNVVKHSDAQTASVVVRKDDFSVSMIVADTGKGFAAPPTHHGQVEGSGLGLQSIGERVRILAGSFSLDSSPERGTILTIILPRPRTQP